MFQDKKILFQDKIVRFDRVERGLNYILSQWNVRFAIIPVFLDSESENQVETTSLASQCFQTELSGCWRPSWFNDLSATAWKLVYTTFHFIFPASLASPCFRVICSFRNRRLFLFLFLSFLLFLFLFFFFFSKRTLSFYDVN